MQVAFTIFAWRCAADRLELVGVLFLEAADLLQQTFVHLEFFDVHRATNCVLCCSVPLVQGANRLWVLH